MICPPDLFPKNTSNKCAQDHSFPECFKAISRCRAAQNWPNMREDCLSIPLKIYVASSTAPAKSSSTGKRDEGGSSERLPFLRRSAAGSFSKGM